MSNNEARALAYVSEREEEIIAFAAELVAAPSENPPGDERRVASVVVDRMRKLGLPNPEVIGPTAERLNVLCRVAGHSTGPVLLYNGHMDTKPVGDRASWNTDPFQPVIKDGQMYGLGACDMKGAVAAMVYAAGALNQVRESFRGELLLALSGDEEAGGKHGAGFLVRERGLSADVALIGEPSSLHRDWENLHLLSRGVCCFKIKVYGTQMHSAIWDVVPSVNASLKMATVMKRMATDLSFRYSPHPLCPQGTTLCPGVRVSAGVFYGMNPGYAEFSSDVRVLPGMTLDGVKADIEAFLQRLRDEDPDLRVELEVEAPPLGWREPLEIDAEHEIVGSALSAAEDVLGRRPPLGAFPAWTDGLWLYGEGGIPTIPAFGPGLLPLAHHPNEHISVDAITQAAKIYTLIALRFLR